MKKYLYSLTGLALIATPLATTLSCSNSNKDTISGEWIRVWAQDENNNTIMNQKFQILETDSTLEDILYRNNNHFEMSDASEYGRMMNSIKNTSTGNWVSAIYGLDNAFWSISSPTYDKDEIDDNYFHSSNDTGDSLEVGPLGINLRNKDIFVWTKIETDAKKKQNEIEALLTGGKIGTNIANAATTLPSEVTHSANLPFNIPALNNDISLTWKIAENGANDEAGELDIELTIQASDWSTAQMNITLTGFQKFETAYGSSSFVRMWARVRDNEDNPFKGTKLFDITFRVTEDITNIATWMTTHPELFKFEGSYLTAIYNSETSEWVEAWNDATWTDGEFWSLWSPTDQSSTELPAKQYNASEFKTNEDKGNFSNDFIGSFTVNHNQAKGHIIGWIYAPVDWMWNGEPTEPTN